jgi:hypothetical protein
MQEQHLLSIGSRRVVVVVARIIAYAIYVYLIIVEVILLLGFVLLLFGANPSADFTQWAYRNLDRVMAPFRGIFTPIEVGTTTGDIPAIFDTSVLFAMIIYGILALMLAALTGWLSMKLRQLHIDELNLQRQRDIERLREEALASSAPPPPYDPPYVGT